MKKILARSVMLVCTCMLLTTTFAQGKAKIYIKKNMNGTTTEETHEVDIAEGEDIQKVLQEIGVLDEFGQLKPGQEFEIKIDKYDLDKQVENLHFHFSPDAPEAIDPPDNISFPRMQSRPFLGVMLRETTAYGSEKNAPDGAYITEVIEGTAAQDAGLLAGDVIIEIDEQKVDNLNDVIEYVQSKKVADEVNVKILREGKKKKIKATLGEKEMEALMPWSEQRDGYLENIEGIDRLGNLDLLREFNFRFDADSITILCPQGFSNFFPNDSMKICQPFAWNGDGMQLKETAFLGVVPVDDDENTIEGVKVNIEEGTSAQGMELMDGDIIIEYNGVKVNSFDELADEIAKTTPSSTISLSILRDGKRKNITGEIGKRSISGCQDFRIFHDFKGMDEGGNYFYDYEFDMDAEDVQQNMQELLRSIDEQQLMLDEERTRLLEDMARMDEERVSVIIKIRIEEVTAEELATVNKTAQPKLSTANDLAIDEISFFPNPGDGVVNLSFSTADRNDVTVVVYDADGNKVYTEMKKNFDGTYKNMIDISAQPNGTYFLQILQGEKSYSKKIVKGM